MSAFLAYFFILGEKTKDLPYSVERNKNHNLPVYVKQTTLRGTKITTVINRVHGDIWVCLIR